MYELTIGTSIAFSENYPHKLSEAKKVGFESVDFDLTTHCSERDEEIALYVKMREGLDAVKGSGLRFNGVHISFGPYWDLSETDETKRLDALKRTEDVIAECDPYCPGHYILHGSFEPIADEARADKIAALRDSLVRLSGETDTLLCVESLPRTCLGNTAKELCEITDGIPGIGVCTDVNHFLQEKPEDAVIALGKRIKTTHISDYDFIDEKHWLPGTGKINWNKLLDAFEKVGYDGVFNLECGSYTFTERMESARALFDRYNGIDRCEEKGL